MEPSALTILLVISFVWLFLYFKHKLSLFAKHNVPHLPGVPLFGNMTEAVLRRKHVSELLIDLYQTYPDAKYMGVFDFGQPVIMFRDPDLIKEIMIKSYENFPEHVPFVSADVDPAFGENVFSISGERWKDTRQMLALMFTSMKLKMMYGQIEKLAIRFVNYLATEPGKMIDAAELFRRYSNDILSNCIFGFDIDSLKDSKNGVYANGREICNTKGLITMLKYMACRASPSIVKLLRLKIVPDHCKHFFEDTIKEAVVAREVNALKRSDMIQTMIDVKAKSSKYLKLDISEMSSHLISLIFASYHTNPTQLSFMAYELTVHPEIQKRLQDKVDEVMQRTNGEPTYKDIMELKYLEAVFQETMRLHTQAYFLDRVCVKPFELPPALPGGKPFTIKPGINIWIPIFAMHRDPKFHDNAGTFDPERFLSKDGSGLHHPIMSFGIGPRFCLGKRFAQLQIKVLIFHLVARFTLKPNAKTPKPMRYSKDTAFLEAEGGFWMTVEPRC